MPKKSFTDNPALRFISAAPEESRAVKMDARDTDHANSAYNTDDVRNAHYTDNAQDMYERKTRRLNLLLRPSLLIDVAKLAHMRRTSVNDLINTLLREYCEGNAELIREYDRVFPQ